MTVRMFDARCERSLVGRLGGGGEGRIHHVDVAKGVASLLVIYFSINGCCKLVLLFLCSLGSSIIAAAVFGRFIHPLAGKFNFETIENPVKEEK